MYYVYVLLSQQDNLFYIGYSTDLAERVKRHKAGRVPATKFRLPVVLIFYEAYIDKSDAWRREKYFKTTKGKAVLKSMLKSYLHRT